MLSVDRPPDQQDFEVDIMPAHCLDNGGTPSKDYILLSVLFDR